MEGRGKSLAGGRERGRERDRQGVSGGVEKGSDLPCLCRGWSCTMAFQGCWAALALLG